MPLSGEAARKYQREYKRRRRAAARDAAKAIVRAVVQRGPGRSLLAQDAEVAQAGRDVLQETLKRSNLDMERIAGKVSSKLDATRPYSGGKAGCIVADDNDAQLRACELGIRLHERAGTIPAAATQGPGAGSLHYHLHLTRLSAAPPDVVEVPARVSDAE